ncbi:hypothetical protein ACS0TY_001753 [Phlomoides rotata]
MYAKLAISSLLLYLLTLQVSAHDHNDIRIEQLHSHTSSQSHMHHIDPSVIVFFFVQDLKLGNAMPIYFPTRELSDAFPRLLSKDEADAIPFSSHHLHHLLHRFAFSPDSPQGNAMKDTLQECEREPIKGETKFCATSWESMSDFMKTIFGSNSQIKTLSTTHIKRSEDHALLQKYTIMGIQEIPAPKTVACHTMPYAYTVFFCHYQVSETRVYRVSLKGENDDVVEAIALCHMDTSQWGRNHVAFQMLGIEPGTSPVCHFFPADNFVCVPSTSTTTQT